jgi:Leucine-rich repeat (LRR) protein
MPSHPKPPAIINIEKNYKIEFGDATDKSWKGGNTYRLNDNGEVLELNFKDFKGVGLVRMGKLLRLKRLVFLNSSLRDLTALKSVCPNLEYLEINADKTLENISGLRLLTQLRYLNIAGTKVWDISALYRLMHDGTLQELNTKRAPLRYPPAAVVDTSSIPAIVSWFDETWMRAKQLIAECLETQNTTLDLGFCGITDLSQFPELFECTHVEKLILSNEWPYYHDNDWELIRSNNKEGVPNNLFYIPNKLNKLSRLKELYISGDWNKRQKDGFWNRGRLQHFHIFTKFTNLEYLNASNQDIRFVSELEKLSHLRILHLNNNRIRSVSAKVPIASLEALFLSNNFLKNVDFLINCPNVTTVDLHHNLLRNLLPIKSLIAKLGVVDNKWAINTISLAKNTTLRLPKYVTIAEGTQSVLDYFDRWEREQQADLPPFINTDIKIILVGNSSVGKTTFAHWLSTGIVDLKLKSTHWLNRMPWKATLRRRSFNVHLFDFGGQEYYHDTHHLFFTTDAVYLLLWDKNAYDFDEIIPENSDKKEPVQTFPLKYWLDSIVYFSNKRQLGKDEIKINALIAKSNADSLARNPANEPEEQAIAADTSDALQKDTLVLQSKVDHHTSIEYLDQKALHGEYPQIYDFANFSLSPHRNLDYLKDLLYEIMRSMPLIDQEMLGSWGAIKKRIEGSANKFKKDLSITKFQTYCNDIIKDFPEMFDAGEAKLSRILFDETNTRNFAQYLSQIGLLLYFPENQTLRNRVFPNQNHLLEQIHDALKAFSNGNGIAEKKEISLSLAKPVKAKELTILIEVMTHFKIVFQHPANSSTLIAPLYLPKEPIKAIQIFLPQFRKPAFRYLFKAFIHRNVVLEFFAGFGKKTLHEGDKDNTYYFWRDGLVLKDEATHEIVLVRFDNKTSKNSIGQACIDVYSLDGRKGEFLKEIIRELDRITEDRQVDKCVTLDGKNFVPLTEIENAENNDYYIFRYKGQYYKLVDFKEYLQKPSQMKNIFISYSKDDFSYVRTFINHLSALQRDGTVGHWYCTELTAGSEWDAEIQQHFKDSDIICFMVSPNFMKTDYIFQYEIKKAFERKKIDAAYKIVPIIMDFCRWKTKEFDLSKFTALPYTAKPIADFDNKNAGWYLVQEAIRIMIEDENTPNGDTFYTYQKLPKDVLDLYERIALKQRI